MGYLKKTHAHLNANQILAGVTTAILSKLITRVNLNKVVVVSALPPRMKTTILGAILATNRLEGCRIVPSPSF